VRQNKSAGPVGRLGVAGREAGLADGRRLLVTGNAADRDRAAEMIGKGRPERPGAVANFRERRALHAEQIEQAIIPAARELHQCRARGVGRIADMQPAGRDGRSASCRSCREIAAGFL
jgi:hypothetical protein